MSGLKKSEIKVVAEGYLHLSHSLLECAKSVASGSSVWCGFSKKNIISMVTRKINSVFDSIEECGGTRKVRITSTVMVEIIDEVLTGPPGEEVVVMDESGRFPDEVPEPIIKKEED